MTDTTDIPSIDAALDAALADPEPEPETEEAQKVHRRMWKYLDMQTALVGENLQDADFPSDGDACIFMTREGLNAFTVLLWIIDNAGPIDDLTVTTYSMNQRIIASFGQLLDQGRIGNLTVVISCSMTRHQPERIGELKGIYRAHADRVRVSLCRNHSKITLARCGENHYVVTGSGNYSFDTKIEQYEMIARRDMYEWMHEELEEMCFRQRHDDRHEVWS